MISLPLGATFSALSQTVIEIVYGPPYLSGSIPLAILAGTNIFMGLSALFIAAIQGIGETKILIKIGASAAATDIILVAILANPLGNMGASIGRVAVFAVTSFLGYRYLRSRIGSFLRFDSRIVLTSSLVFLLLVGYGILISSMTGSSYLPRVTLQLAGSLLIVVAVFRVTRPYGEKDY